jgi:hypothetical protein|mmetsp:Transcript_9254/g.20585  ORF Transcript_9254/g.20585 Transcript_9254/m.20585 type:complete len:116 (+) Transcript_9254:883-1230(+)
MNWRDCITFNAFELRNDHEKYYRLSFAVEHRLELSSLALNRVKLLSSKPIKLEDHVDAYTPLNPFLSSYCSFASTSFSLHIECIIEVLRAFMKSSSSTQCRTPSCHINDVISPLL